MGVTLEDIAVRANLNKGSVSRILNGKGAGYSALTRQRVLQTATELGYQPNMLARALQTGRTNTIGLRLTNEANYSPFFSYLQHCLLVQGGMHGYQIITESLQESTGGAVVESKLLQWPVDGLIVTYAMEGFRQHLQAMQSRGCPIVCLQQEPLPHLAQYPNIDCIFLDLYTGAQEAVTHLLDSGCRRVAFMGQSRVHESDARARAYRDLMGAAGQEAELIVSAGGTLADGYAAMKGHLERNGCPDGIFCPNDEFAMGCYAALVESGIRVPDDVLLVGFNGLENVRISPTPISSVKIPVEAMSELAWTMLLERMKNPDLEPRSVKLETHLEIRSSSQRPSGAIGFDRKPN